MTGSATGSPTNVCLFGASDDTGNRGVSALMTGTALGLARRVDDLRLTVFDHGLGRRIGDIPDATSPVTYTKLGARTGRRYHRGENLRTMALAARLGGLGNQGARHVLNADAVLDISGGDSFTDLYGPRRFDQIVRPKQLALRAGTPLVLLPQTYGPFASRRRRDIAGYILRQARVAYSRGTAGLAAMQELLGADFDPARHREGVDMALTMPTRRPTALAAPLRQVMQQGRSLAGVNVSGLLWGKDTSPYGLTIAYDRVVTELVRRLVSQSDATVVLVPHVDGLHESDVDACRQLAARVARPDRVVVGPSDLDAMETKWLISQTEWFCGTRMHATIAALSSGTPASAVAYSHKTREVFASCGVPDEVGDARRLGSAELTDHLWDSWTRRHQVRATLRSALPATLRAADQQLDDIARAITTAPMARGERSVA